MENNTINDNDWHKFQMLIDDDDTDLKIDEKESLSVDQIENFRKQYSFPPNIFKQFEIQPDVVIIGAGPVGLWTSLRLKEKKPDLNILIYERHKEYQRANLIKVPDPKELNLDKNSPILSLFKTKMTSILEIESILLEESTKHNVKICYEYVENIETLDARHPEAKLWIACDGAHSKIRQQWYNSEPINENLFNIVQVSYSTIDKAKQLNIHQKYKILKKLNIIVEESVEDNKVFLRYFVDKDLFKGVKNFTMKNPLLKFSLIESQKVKQYVEFWIKYRKYYLNESCIPGSFKLTCFKLDSYRSVNFSHFENNRIHVLVGDSAFGVPFYRSMRNGWIASNVLVKLLFENWGNEKGFVKVYNNYMNDFYSKEKKRANGKTKGIDFASLWVSVSSAVPWQISFVTSKKEKEINSMDVSWLI
jgi:hypothetical protein